jgi:hypothetical protein
MTIRWAAIQGQHAANATDHFARAQALGLECPFDVFEQLFHEHHGDHYFAQVVRFIDWAIVEWEETALRRGAAPRRRPPALSTCGGRSALEGIRGDRPEFIEH